MLRHCYLNSLGKFDPRSINMALIANEMLNAPKKGPISKQWKDVEMVQALTERIIPKEGIIDMGLDP